MNESPYGFDVGEGTSIPVINAYIGNYATPEAAKADTMEYAPRGYDYLVNQYQRLTGDSFADPFEDASRARASQISDLQTAGDLGLAPRVGVSVGQFGTTVSGPSLLDRIRFGGTQAPTQGPIGQALGAVGESSPSRGGLLAGVGARAGASGGNTGLLAGSGLVDATLQSAIGEASLQRPEFRLPDDPSSDDYTNIQERRAAALGATDLFKSLTGEALKPVSSVNPELQFDEKGKPVAGDVLNSALFNDPEFQNALKYNRPKAAALYKALYDRDLEQDIGSQRGANVRRETIRTKALAGLADKLTSDEITGEPMIRTYKTDLNGDRVEGPPRKLSDPEKHWLQQEGGYASVYGYEPSAGYNVPGVSPAMATQVRIKMAELRDQNPGESPAKLLVMAKQQLLASRGGGGGGPVPPGAAQGSSPQADWIFRGADFYGPLLNAPIRWNNAMNAQNRPLGLIQGAPLTQAEADQSLKSAEGPSLFDILTRESGGFTQ